LGGPRGEVIGEKSPVCVSRGPRKKHKLNKIWSKRAGRRKIETEIKVRRG